VAGSISTIIETMPKSGGGGGGMSPEELVDKTAEELLAKVPATFHKEDTVDKLRKLPGGPVQPLTVHLRQEIDRLNTILDITRKTLSNLRLAIAGTIALSGDLVDALSCLFNSRIPARCVQLHHNHTTPFNFQTD
jgi:dynein heavy chain